MFIMSDAGPGKLNIGGSGIGADAIRNLAFLESKGEVTEETLLYRVPEIFEMEEPFHLMFITCREESAESAMMLMQSSPDQTFYLSESTSGQGSIRAPLPETSASCLFLSKTWEKTPSSKRSTGRG